VVALGLTGFFGVVTERKCFDTNVIGIEQVLEVAASANIAVNLKDVTVNVSDFNRFEASSSHCHKGIVAQITVKLIF
jgi:hypothetical protein